MPHYIHNAIFTFITFYFFCFRPSPKLVLIILQLCRVALPLMSSEQCDLVELPICWLQEQISELSDSKPQQIVSLLLAKLADYLIPGLYSEFSYPQQPIQHVLLLLRSHW